MPRAIKFRAWARRGEWESDGEKQKFVMINADSLAFEEFLPLSELLCDHDDDFYLMQFTGLKDKNGKEIYEGDILSLDNGSTSFTGKQAVAWDKYDAKWRFSGGIFAYDIPFCEIVGNTYENPELLTGIKQEKI